MKDNFETALKIGQPAARRASENGHRIVVSECPLARDHIVQGMEKLAEFGPEHHVSEVHHPIQVLAKAYGLG